MLPLKHIIDVGFEPRSMAEGQRRILVLEDDRETAEQLVDSLSSARVQPQLRAFRQILTYLSDIKSFVI
jgi:hypothetical protein